MHVVLGANGHVGSAVVRSLLHAGEPVTAVLHDDAHAERWRGLGADVASVDIGDSIALHDVFRRGRRAFVLNPPADPSIDTDSAERATAESIVNALIDSGLEKIVAASTYGAQPGERIGDLSVLFEFEQRLQAGEIPAAINRGAFSRMTERTVDDVELPEDPQRATTTLDAYVQSLVQRTTSGER